MNSVCAVGHILSESIAVFVSNEVITLGILCVVIAACTLDEHLEFRTGFKILHGIIVIIAVLDNGNIALLDILRNIEYNAVSFNNIVLRLCTDIVDLIIELIAL